MLFQKTQLSIYLSKTVEVGYTHYGPTLALSGNLSARHKVALVHDMTVELKRQSGAGRRQFGWLAFRPHTFKVGSSLGIDLKMASRFMVSPAEAYHFNILFSDHDSYARMNAVINLIKNEWNTLAAFHRGKNPQANLSDLFPEFLQKPHIAQANEQLQTVSIWEPGEYAMTVHVITENPQQVFTSSQKFALSKPDVETLRTNVPAILADICGRTAVEYKFVTAALL